MLKAYPLRLKGKNSSATDAYRERNGGLRAGADDGYNFG